MCHTSPAPTMTGTRPRILATTVHRSSPALGGCSVAVGPNGRRIHAELDPGGSEWSRGPVGAAIGRDQHDRRGEVWTFGTDRSVHTARSTRMPRTLSPSPRQTASGSVPIPDTGRHDAVTAWWRWP